MFRFRNENLCWCFLIALACFLVFGPGLHYDFLCCWDDDAYVTANRHLGMNWGDLAYWWTHQMENLLTPLTVNSLALDAWIWGTRDPFGYHLMNLVLHIAGALVLYAIGRKERIPAGILCGIVLLWALHVQRVESVVWITERKDVLSGFLALLAWYCMLDRKVIRGTVLASILGILAVFAKPSMSGAAVLYAVAGIFHRPEGEPWRKTLWRTGIPAGLTVLAALPAYCMVENTWTLFGDPARLILVLIHNFCWYVETAFFPVEANPVYPRVVNCIRPAAWSFAAAALVLAAGVRVYGSLRNWFLRYWPWMLIWGAFFAPTCGIKIFNNTDYCDRYNYFPGLILWFCVGLMARDAVLLHPGWQKRITAVLLVLAAAFGIRSACYLPVWKNPETLFKYAMFSYDRPNLKAVEGLGSIGHRQNRPDLLLQAGTCFLRMAETAAEDPLPEAFKPADCWRDTGYFYCGMAAYLQHDYGTARKCWDLFLNRPSFQMYNVDIYALSMYAGYADICLRAGDRKGAETALKKQLRFLKPGDAMWYRTKSILAWLHGNSGEAETILREGLAEHPGDSWMQSRLKMLHGKTK